MYYSFNYLRAMAFLKRTDVSSILLLFLLYGLTTLFTLVATAWAGSPFIFWFQDTPYLLLGILAYILLLGLLWDGFLIFIGMVSETWHNLNRNIKAHYRTIESTRKIRFFTCGLPSLIIIPATALIVLVTSNITLLSLKLLGSYTQWRDSFLWQIEGPIFIWLTGLSINASPFDYLYHSCWFIELFALFALVVLSRGSSIVIQFCSSFILLFHIGRFLGLLNPVMGPAFFNPDLFVHLDGTLTKIAMNHVSHIMENGVDEAVSKGGMLLGGVSAMPSLHVAMVTLTSYWLAVSKKWTLILTVPWVLLVWTSTVLLGWHYIMDGLGGIFLSVLCVWLNKQFFRLFKNFI